MTDSSVATYKQRTYGAHNIGYGEKPGIVVVDFQTAFTDPRYPLGGAPLIERAVTNTARLLRVARRCDVPVATCYTAYNTKRDMPHWKLSMTEARMQPDVTHPVTITVSTRSLPRNDAAGV